MPILRGAVTFSRFIATPTESAPADWKQSLGAALAARAFEPLDRTQPDDRAAGFVELEDREQTEFPPSALYVGSYAVFSYRVDEIRIPAPVLKDELDRWVKAFELENQRPPGRREKSDAKDEIRHTLRARAPIHVKTYDVNWNVDEGQLLVWAASRKMVEEIQAAVEQAFEVRLEPVVPASVAIGMDIAESALAPTPALSLPGEREARS